MNNKQLHDLLFELIQKDLHSYNFTTDEPVTYDPVELWRIFDRKRHGIELTQKQKINYMKALAVAVFQATNYKFDKKGQELPNELQIEFLAENVRLIDKYYTENMNTSIFAEYPNEPCTPERIEKFRGYIFNKACWLTDTSILSAKVKEWRKDGIKVKPYLTALRKLKQKKSKAVNDLKMKKQSSPNKDWSIEDKKLDELLDEKVDIEKFRDPTIHREIKRTFEEVNQYISETFYYDPAYDIIDLKEYIENDKEPAAQIISSNIEGIARSFGVYDEPKMRQLFQYFDNNRVNEISAGALWGVRYYQMDMPKLWKIYLALDHGAALSKEGKEFLIMQFLMIAMSVYKNHKNFPFNKKTGEAELHRDQMIFLTMMVSDGYKYFQKRYKEKILSIEYSEEREDIFNAIRAYFVERINKARQGNKVKTALPMAMMEVTIDYENSESPLNETETKIDLLELFNEEEFNSIIEKIKVLIASSDIFDSVKRTKGVIKGMNIDQIKTILKSVLSFNGYKIYKDNETENSFLMQGPKKAIHSDNALNEGANDGILGVTIHKTNFDEKSLEEAIKFNKQNNVERCLLITADNEFSKDFKAKRKKVLRNFETWELLDLAEMIQHTYSQMNEEECREIDSLVQELIIDF